MPLSSRATPAAVNHALRRACQHPRPSTRGLLAILIVMALMMLSPWEAVAQADPPHAAQGADKPQNPGDAGTPAAVTWPDYTRRTGYVPRDALPTEVPEVLYRLVSQTLSSPRDERQTVNFTDPEVAEGVLYFADRGTPARVFAARASDGFALWEHQHDAGDVNAKPSVDRDHVYFGSKSGVTALRRDNGAEVWHCTIPHGAGEGVPLPVGEHVLISGYDGKAYALDRSDGHVVWQHDFATDAPPDPPGFDGQRARFREIVARPNGATSDGELFLQSVFDQSRVIALDCATGERRWSFQAQGWISPAPTIAADRVYVCSQDKHLYCLDRHTGKELWKFAAPTWLASRVAVHEDIVFLPVHRGRLYQLDAETGKLLRTFESPEDEGLVYSFPIVTDKLVCVAAGKGQLLAIDIATSQLVWKLRPSEESELFTDPVTDGTRILVTSRQGIKATGECAVIAIGRVPEGIGAE